MNELLLPCSFKQTFGIECPTCGFQRAFTQLLKGDFYHSFILFPALLPMLFMFIYLIIHIRYKFRNGHRILLVTFICNAVFIYGSYIFKFINL